MKKTITIILTILIILAEILVMPTAVYKNYNVLKFLALMLGGFLLLILLLASYKTLKIDKKDVLVLIFLGIAFLSTAFSSNIRTSILGSENRYEGLLMFATYAIIYFCSKKYFEYKNMKTFFNIMFYVSIAIGVLGVLQRHIDFIKLFPLFNKGICSTFGNSNFYGSYISIVLPIAISAYVLSESKKGFILSLLMFFNMIASGTRSVWVAFLAVAILGFMYLIKQKNKIYFKKAIILLLCFILIFSYLYTGIGTKGKSITKSKFNNFEKDIVGLLKKGVSNEIGSGRIEIWKMTLKLISKKPLLGCGVDNLKVGLLENCPDEAWSFIKRSNVIADKAHNDYLQIAATMGVPNLIIYLVFISMVLFQKMKEAFKEKSAFIISLVIISYLVQAFFNISTIGVAPLFWMILGLSDNEKVIKYLKKLEKHI